MRQSGEYRIGARADAVWLALTDPEVLSLCIDGCQSITRPADNTFALAVKVRIGAVSAVFTADITLADVDPPHDYTLQVSVKGGAAGFAKGLARISLAEEGRDTLLHYEVDGDVGGQLAQAGQRLIEADARRMADDFFARFGEVITHAGTRAAAERAPALRPNLVAPILIAVAAIAGLSALLRRRRPIARTRTEKTA